MYCTGGSIQLWCSLNDQIILRDRQTKIKDFLVKNLSSKSLESIDQKDMIESFLQSPNIEDSANITNSTNITNSADSLRDLKNKLRKEHYLISSFLKDPNKMTNNDYELVLEIKNKIFIDNTNKSLLAKENQIKKYGCISYLWLGCM